MTAHSDETHAPGAPSDRAPSPDRTAGEEVWVDEMVNVELTDADLYVERVGPPDAPVLYYLHGGPGYNSHSFRDLTGDELERYQTIYADQRGSGRSYATGPVTPARLADDVAAVLDALDLGQAVLLAHGFGAAVAVEVAVRHPRHVKGLLLINPWLSMPLLARDVHRAALTISGYPNDGASGDEPPDDPAALANEAFGLANPKKVFDAMEFPNPSSRLKLEHSDSLALHGPSEEDELLGTWELQTLDAVAVLTQPLVVVSGKLDMTSYPTQVEAVLERRPDALTSLLDAGHYPWLDDPDEFFPLLHEALAHLNGSQGE